MLIGLIADTHENLPKIELAMAAFAERGVKMVLHAGDFVAPFAMKALLKPGIPVVGVFGNNDGERQGLLSLCESLGEPPRCLELGGRAIVLTHDMGVVPEELLGRADLVVCGHTHEAAVAEGPPLIVNPGEAGGWLYGRCTAAVADLAQMRVEIIDLGSQETVVI